MRRVAALYAEDQINARIIDRELVEHAPRVTGAEAAVTLSDLIERKLGETFSERRGCPGPGYTTASCGTWRRR
jgi:hypothetical protein